MIQYKIEKGAFRALLTQHHYEHSNLHSSTHIAMSVLIQSPAPYQVQGFIAPAIKHDCSRHSEHWLSSDCQNLLRDAYHILLYPLCTVVLVFGILWLFAGIKWKKEPSFLVWLGGSAVFYIFVLHFIPIRIIPAGRLEGPYPIMSSDIGGVIIQEPMGWGAIYPEISIIGMIGSTRLLAYVVQLIVSRIDVWIFERKK